MSRPLIGIGADIVTVEGRERAAVNVSYAEAVRRAGAIPLLLPPEEENLGELIDRLDGILLAGGNDCDPAVYGQSQHPSVALMDARRQKNDLALAAFASERGMPLLGICLGIQIINVARGGTLIQDIRSADPSALLHESHPTARVRHDVEIREGTKLAAIVGAGRRNVNSSHHQAIGELGSRLRVTAQAADGIIEAVEDPSGPFHIGVQWHPEDMPGEQVATDLFTAFVAAAGEYASQRGRREAAGAAIR